MKKIIGLFLVCALCAGTMVGCNEDPKADRLGDFSGTWRQVNSNSEDSYQEATISDNLIEIFWVTDGGDSKSLYWVGTYIPPETEVESYSWESTNDHERTDSSLLASSDDTKTFNYGDGQLYYEVSALGSTTTVRLERR